MSIKENLDVAVTVQGKDDYRGYIWMLSQLLIEELQKENSTHSGNQQIYDDIINEAFKEWGERAVVKRENPSVFAEHEIRRLIQKAMTRQHDETLTISGKANPEIRNQMIAAENQKYLGWLSGWLKSGVAKVTAVKDSVIGMMSGMRGSSRGGRSYKYKSRNMRKSRRKGPK